MHVSDLTKNHILRMGDVVDIHSGIDFTPDIAADLAAIGGWAIEDGGEVLAIGGVLPYWSGNGLGWMWLAKGWRRKAKAVTQTVMAILDSLSYNRIEIGVLYGFEAGCRWAERLGFALEIPRAKKWGPDGLDYSVYVRVR